MKSAKPKQKGPDFPEAFLHFIWQHQYLNPSGLKTTDGQPVMVHFPGWLNSDAGPDFHQARLRIGAMEWTGSVEIHIRSSDFNRHQHQSDQAYDNVILHVVWRSDQMVYRPDGTPLPEVELHHIVDAAIINRYAALTASSRSLPCGPMLAKVNPDSIREMMDQAATLRLEDWASRVLEVHESTRNDWQETVWRMLARAVGLRVNADAMQTLAGRLPLRILARYRDQPLRVEALLFGVAGFLKPIPRDDYERSLRTDFDVLASAHRLQPMSEVEWRFSRMRPPGFPTVRLAQLAAIICCRDLSLGDWMEISNGPAWSRLLQAEVSTYWQHHLHFNKPARLPMKMGEDRVRIIRINAIIPLLFAYGKIHASPLHQSRAIEMMQEMSTEENQVTRMWKDVGIRPKTAWESQALLWKSANHCRQRSCLECPVGCAMLRQRVFD